MLTQAVAVLVLAGAAVAQTFSISTPPSIQQCQPAALSWTGGTAPYILAAIPQGQTTAAALATIADNVSGNSYTWNVNLPQGTAINIRITDATGAINYSSGLTVQAGSSGCLSGASASGSAVTSAVPASSGAATGAPSASQTSAASASSARASSASAAAASSSGAASSAASSGGNLASSLTSAGASVTSRAAAASSTGAASSKMAFQLPVLAVAAAGAFVFLGGFAVLA